MARGINSLRKVKPKTKLIFRLLVPMLLLVLLQLVTFFAILIIGGEFKYVEQYAYNTLVEKTENRKNYLENELSGRMPVVQEYADKVDALIADILNEHGAAVSDIQKDRSLNRQIMESSADTMIDLLRRSMVNDVYLILETGDLYSGDDGSGNAKLALYLRDLDPMTDAGYEDLLMEMGLSSIAQDLGIILDSGWKLYFEPDPNDMKSYDYFYKTIQTAEENKDLNNDRLGCWTDFSSFSKNASSSMKYSVPLIAEDGTVYGVVGIGMTENTIVSNLPVHDFMSETACYVLGFGKGDVQAFSIVTHSGISFERLVGNTKALIVGRLIDEKIWDFDIQSDVQLIGSVQYLNVYSEESPYYGERWALISVADRLSVLRPLITLRNMLLIAAIISLGICIVIVFLISRAVVKPITAAIKTMNDNHQYNEVIRFESSNIYEIDKMTDAITQLQINVQEFSSQVSKMISIANVGLGAFMYDRVDGSVFVGQSLIPLLHTKYHTDGDIVMDREAFLESIAADETRFAVAKSLRDITRETQTDTVHEFSIAKDDGSTVWMRLSLVHNKNKSIGILEDITGTVMEKKRIEYERDYDSTTGLLNRHAYQSRLEDIFSEPEKLGVTAFIMLDLDNLKFVNDTYGHDFGDDYIKTAATALRNFEKRGGIVSRLSGDEFNVCLPGFSSKDEVRQIIEEVRAHLL